MGDDGVGPTHVFDDCVTEFFWQCVKGGHCDRGVDGFGGFEGAKGDHFKTIEASLFFCKHGRASVPAIVRLGLPNMVWQKRVL